MVRECRPPAREPARSWLARRSTIATSTPANANSPASISPVGPPPAITTACLVMATLLLVSPLQVPATASPVPPSVRRTRAIHATHETHATHATYTSTTTHAWCSSPFRRFLASADEYTA